MDRDDREVGTLLSRREVLALLGASGAVLVAAGAPRLRAAAIPLAAPSCVVRPEQMEGPYFVDGGLARSDIRSDPGTGERVPGVPLEVEIVVSHVSSAGCTPFAGVRVDLWQCDALGMYSQARDRRFYTRGREFLRGYQVTDGAGSVRFVTIYPGWYEGRAVHLHFKLRADTGAARGVEFTSQLYFDEALTDRVHAAEPYASHPGRRTRNRDDRIFRGGGERLMLDATAAGDGYAGRFDVGLSLG